MTVYWHEDHEEKTLRALLAADVLAKCEDPTIKLSWSVLSREFERLREVEKRYVTDRVSFECALELAAKRNEVLKGEVTRLKAQLEAPK